MIKLIIEDTKVGKIQNNQKGFSAVEGLLILIIVVLIGVVGYMVYKNHHKTTIAPVTTASKSTAPAKPVNLYAGWKSYTLKYEKLSFKYPSQWTVQNDSGSQGLTPNTDTVTLTSNDGYQVNIDDGWDGSGDPISLTANSPYPINFAGNNDYIVFKTCGGRCQLSGGTPNTYEGGLLMTNPVSQYTVSDFPQDKNAHGDPNINNGGSTMLIGGGYTGTNAKSFTTISEAAADPEFKNFVLVLQSMHY